MSRFDSPPLRRPYSTFASALVASRLCSWPKKDAGIPRRNSYVSSYYLVLSAILAFLNQQMIFISAEAAPAPFASIDHNTRRMQGTHHGQGPEKPTYCQRHRNVEPSTFLWRVKRQPAAYFFGTIHVPYTEVWDYVSAYAKEAFRSADTVFLELVLTNPSTLRELSMCQLLPGDEVLSDHIPKEMYERLKRLMERMKKALPSLLDESDVRWAHSTSYIDHMFDEITGNWHRKRPVWVMTMLDSLSVDTFRHRGEPTLDLYLAQEAALLDKSLGPIESVREQCHPLNTLDKKHALIALNRTLAKQEAFVDNGFSVPSSSTRHGKQPGRTVIRDLVENYNCGTLNETVFSINSALAEGPPDGEELSKADFDIDTYFRQQLIDKRNERMAERVLRLLDSDREKSFFFAFGAAHFFGAQSVIELVKRAGYEVEAVPLVGWYDEDTVVSRRSKNRQNTKQPRRQRGERKPTTRRPLVQRPYQPAANTPTPDWLLDPERPWYGPDPGASTPRQRIFQELWVRMDGYTPRPWSAFGRASENQKTTQERLSSLIVADTPKSYVVVQYHHYHASSSARCKLASSSVFLLILILLCRFSIRH